MTMPTVTLTDDLAGGDIQRRKQRGGPVPRIIMGATFGLARTQG